MSLPKICTCPTVPAADCPFHHRNYEIKQKEESVAIDVLLALGAMEHEGPRLAAMRVVGERNVARVVASDAIREIERILETGDTYCTQEIVINLKNALSERTQP